MISPKVVLKKTCDFCDRQMPDFSMILLNWGPQPLQNSAETENSHRRFHFQTPGNGNNLEPWTQRINELVSKTSLNKRRIWIWRPQHDVF